GAAGGDRRHHRAGVGVERGRVRSEDRPEDTPGRGCRRGRHRRGSAGRSHRREGGATGRGGGIRRTGPPGDGCPGIPLRPGCPAGGEGGLLVSDRVDLSARPPPATGGSTSPDPAPGSAESNNPHDSTPVRAVCPPGAKQPTALPQSRCGSLLWQPENPDGTVAVGRDDVPAVGGEGGVADVRPGGG